MFDGKKTTYKQIIFQRASIQSFEREKRSLLYMHRQ